MSEFHQNNFFDDLILSDNHGQNNVVQMTDQHFNTMMGMPQHPQLQLLPGIHCEFLKIEPSSPTQIQLEPFGTDQTPAQSMTEFSHQGLVPMQGPNQIKEENNAGPFQLQNVCEHISPGPLLLPIPNFQFNENVENSSTLNYGNIQPTNNLQLLQPIKPIEQCITPAVAAKRDKDVIVWKENPVIDNEVQKKAGTREHKSKSKNSQHKAKPASKRSSTKKDHTTAKTHNHMNDPLIIRSKATSSKAQPGSKYSKLRDILANLEEQEETLEQSRSKDTRTNKTLHCFQVEVAQLMKNEQERIIKTYSANKTRKSKSSC